MFPVEINSAPYELLIKVPGIGLKSAKNYFLQKNIFLTLKISKTLV